MPGYTYAALCEELHGAGLLAESIGRTALGREIWCVRLGHGPARLLLVGTHHGREYITAKLLARMAEEMQRSGVYGMADAVSVCIVPMLNPDGADIASLAEPAPAEMQLFHGTATAWKANGRGIDLNRHYPCLFYEKERVVQGPASEGYGGEQPGVEAEVQALMALCEAEQFQLAGTFHAKGEEIYYGDAHTPRVNRESRRIARQIARQNGYALAPVSRNPAKFAGGFENWFRSRFLRPCLLFEVTPYMGGAIPHPMETFEALAWRRAGDIGRFLAEYLTNAKKL